MRTKLVLLTAIFFTVFLSCSKEIEEVSNLDQTHSQLRSGRTAGRSQSVVDISQTREKGKYNNPYYIGTIKAAYLKLKSLGQISATYNISPNALYVRYLPKDENDFYLLETTSPTELFEYPLQENDIQNNEIHHEIFVEILDFLQLNWPFDRSKSIYLILMSFHLFYSNSFVNYSNSN